MGLITMFDPEALAQRQQMADEATAKVSSQLKRHTARAVALREAAASTGSDKSFKQAEYLERDVLDVLDMILALRAVVAVHEKENASAQATIRLQEIEIATLKTFAEACALEASSNALQFDSLTDSFTAYVASHTGLKNG